MVRRDATLWRLLRLIDGYGRTVGRKNQLLGDLSLKTLRIAIISLKWQVENLEW